jgi:hypothetical protein
MLACVPAQSQIFISPSCLNHSLGRPRLKIDLRLEAGNLVTSVPKLKLFEHPVAAWAVQAVEISCSSGSSKEIFLSPLASPLASYSSKSYISWTTWSELWLVRILRNYYMRALPGVTGNSRSENFTCPGQPTPVRMLSHACSNCLQAIKWMKIILK